MLTWLRNDPAGTYTHEVEQNFYQLEGIELVRSVCIVEASGAADEWQSPMQERAREILNEWNADVAIVGSARSSNEGIQLSLWFVSRAGTDTLGRQEPYALTVPLPKEFREDLGAQVAAVALSAAAPAADTEARGQVLTDGLEAVVKRIGNLLASSTIPASERRAALHVAHGNALQTQFAIDVRLHLPATCPDCGFRPICVPAGIRNALNGRRGGGPSMSARAEQRSATSFTVFSEGCSLWLNRPSCICRSCMAQCLYAAVRRGSGARDANQEDGRDARRRSVRRRRLCMRTGGVSAGGGVDACNAAGARWWSGGSIARCGPPGKGRSFRCR